MTTFEQFMQDIKDRAEKPMVSARFGDNWKDYQKKNLDDGETSVDDILEIAWRQGRVALLLENEVKRLQKICSQLAGEETAHQEGALFFGSKCTIEQKRHGAPNEHYTHKVIANIQSNTWVEVPVQTPRKEVIHEEMQDVVLCICEGVDETEVKRYRRIDCKSTFL